MFYFRRSGGRHFQWRLVSMYAVTSLKVYHAWSAIISYFVRQQEIVIPCEFNWLILIQSLRHVSTTFDDLRSTFLSFYSPFFFSAIILRGLQDIQTIYCLLITDLIRILIWVVTKISLFMIHDCHHNSRGWDWEF